MANVVAPTPVRLTPVHIPKPWGQEIWYTGMEARGESSVVDADGRAVPLSAYLGADPAATCNGEDVLLLKVLDPSPEPVRGDLYFEVHEEKREVYVVTAVDRTAWPAGVGAIRFGMNQPRRRAFDDDDAFRAAYLNAVTAYEAIRRAIDAGDTGRAEDEQAARAEMDAFTAIKELQVGDVVQVPTWTPHSLQHGVRVVEFQTPTYERLIVSFAQRVLTQDHWDTAAAVARMHLDPPAPPRLAPVAPGVERIATFEGFNVWRLRGSVELPAALPYAVCMAIDGTARIGDLELAHEAAAFVPRAALAAGRVTVAAGDATVLIAAPGL